MKLLVLFSILAVVYGQYRIPTGVEVQCFTTSSCDLADEEPTRTGMFNGDPAEINHCCFDVDINDTITQIADPANAYFSLAGGECRRCTHESVVNTMIYSCFDNVAAGTCDTRSNFDMTLNDVNMCCDGNFEMINYQIFGSSSDPCLSCNDIGNGFGVGNDPHFFLPLENGDHMCFSIQGEPDFAFNLINDKYIQLNGQFVLPAEEESHTISNVTTFMGSLGLLVTSPDTGATTVIEVSALDHSVLVGNSLTIVKEKPVTVVVSNTVSIIVDANIQTNRLKDESAWLHINTNAGFGMKVRFYKKHVDLFFTKTSGLTKAAHGLIGQFLTVDVKIDVDYNIMKLGDHKPISVRKGESWPFLGVSEECWYGVFTDNQGTGIIEGVYTDYIVENLVPPKK